MENAIFLREGGAENSKRIVGAAGVASIWRHLSLAHEASVEAYGCQSRSVTGWVWLYSVRRTWGDHSSSR
jgi:hypothetical protein